MRIATMIISLVLVLPIFLHACGSPLLGDSSTAEGQDAASVAMGLGFLVGILYFLGGAFALGVPLLAAILFLGP